MLSGVGAAIYVFIETGSAAWLGLLSALAALPYVLTGPFATVVDRLPRRQVMIWSDVGAALGPLFALVMVASGNLEVWHLAVAGFIGGIGNSFQMPASQAAVPSLAHPGAIDRANSLKQLGPAIGVVIGPVLAAPIVAWWGIEAILLIDVVTFAIGVIIVALVPFEDHRDDEPVADDGSWSMMWAWLSTDGRPLLVLMGATAVVNFVLAFFNVSILALATDVGGVARAGTVLGAGGAAMIVGSVVAAQRGLPEDRIGAVARVLALMGIGFIVTALRPSFALVIVGVVVALGTVPVVNAAMSTIYNERVPASMQGRVFALRGAISRSLLPLGSVLAGAAITRVAAPAIDDGGALASSLGALIGTGRERGPAVVMFACALGLLAISMWLQRSNVRRELQPPSQTMSDERDELGEVVRSSPRAGTTSTGPACVVPASSPASS